jgi:DNA transformation protein
MNDFVAHLLDLLAPLGAVSSRRMFGGYGLYHGGLMFALIADDFLYLKADESNRSRFERLALPRFSYERKGKTINLSYYLVPDEALDDSAELCDWARSSIAAALRADSAKPGRD